jgi:hypothetical protein
MSDLSPLDRVRRRYDELRNSGPQTLHIPVGRGLGGSVVVEYSEPEWEDSQEIQERWLDDESPRALLYAAAERLAKCCVDIHIRDDENGKALPHLPGKYLPGLGGENTATFQSAATTLGKPVDDPLQAVWVVLLSDWEVKRHERLLSLWEPSTPSKEDQETLLGESAAATAA